MAIRIIFAFHLMLQQRLQMAHVTNIGTDTQTWQISLGPQVCSLYLRYERFIHSTPTRGRFHFCRVTLICLLFLLLKRIKKQEPLNISNLRTDMKHQTLIELFKLHKISKQPGKSDCKRITMSAPDVLFFNYLVIVKLKQSFKVKCLSVH
jgi:hypothetical protein